MKFKYILLIILIQLLFSCTSNKEENDLARLFNCKEKLNTGEKKNLFDFKEGELKAIVGDSLALFQQDKTDTMFTLYNLSNGSIKVRFGLRGNGPGELIMPRNTWYNESTKSFTVYDVSRRILLIFSTDSLYANPRYTPKSFAISEKINLGFVLSIAPVNDSLMLCIGTFNKGVYGLVDQKNSILMGNFGQYPSTEDTKGVPNFVLGTAHQGELYAHPDGQRVTHVARSYGAVTFLEYENGALATINTYLFHPPKFETVTFPTGGQSACFSKKSRDGFESTAVTRKYIFALYSGRTVEEFGNGFAFGRDIYVFDWDGNPVKHYKLNRDASSIGVDSDSKSLYVLFVDKDYSFEKFQLSGL